MGDPRMTEHFGGPETPEKLRARHERYVAIGGTGKGAMFVICAGPDAEAVGSIGYWELEWAGQTAWETGWSVVPEWQGQGIATIAAVLVLERARGDGKHRSIHAFPAFENEASNAVCRKAGFTLVGECEVEFPPGRPMRANDWVVAADWGALVQGATIELVTRRAVADEE